jgi:catechol 2,3-dioxygenase-like lactoylglutathione lyase family enzyme
MPRVVHFEISAEDPQRAADFYTRVFGWKITKWPGPQDYWLVTTGEAPEPGINGGLFRRMGPVGHVNTISVENVDVTAKQVEGGRRQDRRAEDGDSRRRLAGLLPGHRGERFRDHALRPRGEVRAIKPG